MRLQGKQAGGEAPVAAGPGATRLRLVMEASRRGVVYAAWGRRWGVRQAAGCLPALSLCTVSPLCTATAPQPSQRRAAGYWKEEKNRRSFLDDVLETEGGGEWAAVTTRAVVRRGGGSLLNLYGGSLAKALEDTYGEEEMGGQRMKTGRNQWASEERRREEMERIKDKLGIERMEQWDTVTGKDVQAAGGRSLLRHYGDSVLAMLQDCLPEEAEGYQRVPRGYWQSKERQKEFLDALAEAKSVESPKDWQCVTTEDVRRAGGGGLLVQYEGSLLKALRAVYGGGKEMWDPTTCRPSVRSRHWAKEENVRSFLYRLERDMQLKRPEEWLRVSVEQLRAAGGRGLLDTMPWHDALAIAYPQVQWEAEMGGQRSPLKKKASQLIMRAKVAAIFPSIGGGEEREEREAES